MLFSIQKINRDTALFMYCQNISRVLAVAVLMMSVEMPVAQAVESGDEPTFHMLFQPPIVNAKWKQECSVCHIPFPPGLLQAESWFNIMDSLENHFGVDASLTAKENNEITAFLVNNASTRWRYPVPPSRISETSWFKTIHSDHRAAWKGTLVKTPANCFACHKHSEHGDFKGGGGGCGDANCHVF